MGINQPKPIPITLTDKDLVNCSECSNKYFVQVFELGEVANPLIGQTKKLQLPKPSRIARWACAKCGTVRE